MKWVRHSIISCQRKLLKLRKHLCLVRHSDLTAVHKNTYLFPKERLAGSKVSVRLLGAIKPSLYKVSHMRTTSRLLNNKKSHCMLHTVLRFPGSNF